MTEAEWLCCDDPALMLEFLGARASERKLCLFACACCRRLKALLTDEDSQKVLGIAERYADAEMTRQQLEVARSNVRREALVAHRQERSTRDAFSMWVVSMVCEADISSIWTAVAAAAECEAGRVSGRAEFPNALRKQAAILREMFGNPFRASSAARTWLVWGYGIVPKLAQAIYEERAFDRLPILADALEDAGCANAELLAHLRGPGPHVRGCWVVDLLLGKE
jgi:hypothetical protein